MLKRFFAKVFAFIIVRKIENTYSKSFKIQEKILFSLLKKASNTQFGVDHKFNKIENYEFFKKNVPVRDYEGFSTYISKIKKHSELWTIVSITPRKRAPWFSSNKPAYFTA